MKHSDIAALAKGFSPVVRDAIADATRPIGERLKKLEAMPPGRDGIDGKDGAPGLDGKDGAPGLDGKDGAPGLDGKDGAPGPQGEKGDPGERGADGKDGRDGVDGKDGDPGPQGEKGDPGERGADGRDGIDGKDGPPGERGPQGERGLQGERGEKGDPGRDGRDASDFAVLKVMAHEIFLKEVSLIFSSMLWTSDDGGRTMRATMKVGDEIIVHDVKTANVLDRGVWSDAKSYEKGDGVSFGGSFFVAQVDTREKPEVSKDWRLAVKRGQNGRDGRDGPPGPQGPKGDPGRGSRGN